MLATTKMADNFYVKSDGNFNNSNMIPDYIRVKQNILDLWFKIQKEYQMFVSKRSFNLAFGSTKIFSLIKVLYFGNLQTLFKKSIEKESKKKEKGVPYNDKYEKFAKFMEDSRDKVLPFSESHLAYMIGFLSDYLYDIGLTKVDFEVRDWQDTFSESYGD